MTTTRMSQFNPKDRKDPEYQGVGKDLHQREEGRMMSDKPGAGEASRDKGKNIGDPVRHADSGSKGGAGPSIGGKSAGGDSGGGRGL